MRREILTLAALGFCLIVLSGCWLVPMVLDESSDGSVQTLSVGDTVIIALKGNASSGYQWIRETPDSINGDPLVTISEGEYEVDDPDVCGGPGTFRFSYQASTAGVITLAYEYRRPWEDDFIDTFSVVIWVQ